MVGQRVLLSRKFLIGIVDADKHVNIEDTITAVNAALDGSPAHFVDFTAWHGEGSDIRDALLKHGHEIDDHHEGFAGRYLTATSSIIDRYRKGDLTLAERTVLTFRPNIDGDGAFSMFMALHPDHQYSSQIEQAAIFSDCTMFGGQVFDDSYNPKEPAELLALAVNSLIYQKTFENFPKDLLFLKGVPADKPGIAEAAVAIYEQVLEKLPGLINCAFESRQYTQLLKLVEPYLEKLRAVNRESVKRAKHLIPDTMVYINKQGPGLDTVGNPYWLAEGNGQWTKSHSGNTIHLSLSETGVGYILGSADTRKKPGDRLDYDLRQLLPKLSELSGVKWSGKDSILFGARGPNRLTPEQIAHEVSNIYRI